MTLPTKVGDGSRQRPRHSPHVGQRSRPRGRPSGPAPGQAADLIGRRLASALGQVAEQVPALAAMHLDERVEAALACLDLCGVRPQSGGLEESGDEGAAARRGQRQLVAAVGADEPRAVHAGDEAGLEPVGAPLRSGQKDQLELACRRRQQDEVVHGRHDAGDEVREALEEGQARVELPRGLGIEDGIGQ